MHGYILKYTFGYVKSNISSLDLSVELNLLVLPYTVITGF